MVSEGWFKIHRCLFDKAIWTNSTLQQKVILITILGMANHEEKEWEWNGKQYKAKPGQLVTSANSIMEKAGSGISRQNVRTALNKFRKYGFLTYESTKTGMLISIVNWGIYQGERNGCNKGINIEAAKVSPKPNQPLTTNKNEKNYKNDKNNINISKFTENELLRENIIDFIKMREKIKKPMTDKALKLMLKKLEALSQDEDIQIKILENSIENCWQGIYPLKEEGSSFNYGSSTKNNDTSEKKFNVKIPEWKPRAKQCSAGDEPL